MASDWYRQRLLVKQRRDIALWQRHVAYLTAFLARPSHADEAARLGLVARLAQAERQLGVVAAPAYLASLSGTIGADPMGEMVEAAALKAAAVS
jgi:hypothetical protein